MCTRIILLENSKLAHLYYDELKFELQVPAAFAPAVKLRLVAAAGQGVKKNKRNLLINGLTRYRQIKELWSLNMLYYLVAGELIFY